MARKLEQLALIIGAMKAGTTTLFDTLADHSAIAPCVVKEPCFFAYPYRWEEGIDAYEALFNYDPARHRYALEATTDYAKLPYLDYVLDRMASVEEYNYRFIYLIRHPVHRARSQVAHVAATGSDILSIKPVERLPSPVAGVPRSAINLSRYADHISAYEERFGKGCVRVEFFEDLVSDPQSVVDSVCSFLSIDQVVVSQIHSNPRRDQRENKAWRVMRSSNLARRAWSLVPGNLQDQLYHRFGAAPIVPEFRIGPEQEEAMLRELRYDMLSLRDKYGLDVEAKWGVNLSGS